MKNRVELKLRAKVVEKDGIKHLEFTNKQYYLYMLNRLNLKENVIVTIENQKSKRSGQQNNYLWGVCYPTIAEHTGNTSEEIHELMKEMFLPKKFIELKGIEFAITKSSKKLSITECSEYIEKIINFAGTELETHILSPCEAGYSCGREDCQICNPQENEAQTGGLEEYPTENNDGDAITAF